MSWNEQGWYTDVSATLKSALARVPKISVVPFYLEKLEEFGSAPGTTEPLPIVTQELVETARSADFLAQKDLGTAALQQTYQVLSQLRELANSPAELPPPPTDLDVLPRDSRFIPSAKPNRPPPA